MIKQEDSSNRSLPPSIVVIGLLDNNTINQGYNTLAIIKVPRITRGINDVNTSKGDSTGNEDNRDNIDEEVDIDTYSNNGTSSSARSVDNKHLALNYKMVDLYQAWCGEGQDVGTLNIINKQEVESYN